MFSSLPRLLLAVLLLLPLATLGQEEIPSNHTVPPTLWQSEDTNARQHHFAVEVATFPSAALAESVRSGLVNMGWGPVYTMKAGDGTKVCLGNFAALGEAEYFARELQVQEVADAKVMTLDAAAKVPEEIAEGPVLPAFLPTPLEGEEPAAKWESVRRELMAYKDTVIVTEANNVEECIAKLDSETDQHLRGPAAAQLVDLLVHDRKHPEAALYLAGKVAREQWPADPETRIRCGEVVADLLYGHRRDWRGAWSATRSLLADPLRDRDGRTRDRLRQVALLIDLVAEDADPAPSWQAIRAALRRTYDGATVDNRRLLAKIELVYMQTFAWEGRWDRVEMLARDVVRRYPQQRPETALSRIYLARSLERKRDWGTALEQLDLLLQMDLPPEGSLTMGFEPLDLKGMARKERERLAGLAAGADE
ncbi:MAG: hypothetical protein PWP23_557 [Candidatus Sumerlaeota bacterium]|nr:hypothetical protein [Candidatus Sumerlaeota bacterium]